MFNKYFEFIKNRFDSVFSSGESVSFLDYLYTILFTLAIVATVAVCVVVLLYAFRLPFIVYKRFVRKNHEAIAAIDEKIASSSTEDATKLFEQREALTNALTKKRWIFGLGVTFLYIPILIPTLLFIASFVKSWF